MRHLRLRVLVLLLIIAVLALASAQVAFAGVIYTAHVGSDNLGRVVTYDTSGVLANIRTVDVPGFNENSFQFGDAVADPLSNSGVFLGGKQGAGLAKFDIATGTLIIQSGVGAFCPAHGTNSRTFSVRPSDGHVFAVDPLGSNLCAPRPNFEVLRFDNSLAFVTSLTLPVRPDRLDVLGSTRLVVHGRNKVSLGTRETLVVDATSGLVIATLSTGTIRGIAADRSGGTGFWIMKSSGFEKYDSSGTLLGTVAIPAGFADSFAVIDFRPDGGFVAVDGGTFPKLVTGNVGVGIESVDFIPVLPSNSESLVFPGGNNAIAVVSDGAGGAYIQLSFNNVVHMSGSTVLFDTEVGFAQTLRSSRLWVLDVDSSDTAVAINGDGVCYAAGGETPATAPADCDTTLPVMGALTLDFPADIKVGVAQRISATFSDSVAVTSCRLFVDSVDKGLTPLLGVTPSVTGLYATAGTAVKPYAFATAGSHTVEIRCKDPSGNVGIASTSVTVAAASPKNVWVATPSNVTKRSPDGSIICIATGFSGPRGIAVSGSGEAWVSDTQNNRVVKLDSNCVQTFAATFTSPRAIDVDQVTGDVWFIEGTNLRRLSSSGTILLTKNMLSALGATSANLRDISVNSVDDGQGAGNIWIGGEFRSGSFFGFVRKFTPTGGTRVTINEPIGFDVTAIVVNPLDGSAAYATDSAITRRDLHKVSSTGAAIFTVDVSSSSGTTTSIDVNPNDDGQGAGNYWVGGPRRIFKFDSSGSFIRQIFTSDFFNVRADSTTGQLWTGGGSSHTLHKFSPSGVEEVNLRLGRGIGIIAVAVEKDAPAAPAVCGNGMLEMGEACDDGNTVPGDGCSATCTIECTDPDGDDFGDPSTDLSDCSGSTTVADNCPSDPNPAQLDTDGQNGGDQCDVCPFTAAASCVLANTGAGLIDSSGGTVTDTDISVTVPAGSVSSDTEFVFEVSNPFNFIGDWAGIETAFTSALVPVITFSPTGLTFSPPVIACIDVPHFFFYTCSDVGLGSDSNGDGSFDPVPITSCGPDPGDSSQLRVCGSVSSFSDISAFYINGCSVDSSKVLPIPPFGQASYVFPIDGTTAVTISRPGAPILGRLTAGATWELFNGGCAQGVATPTWVSTIGPVPASTPGPLSLFCARKIADTSKMVEFNAVWGPATPAPRTVILTTTASNPLCAPPDSDGDGVLNPEDACADTPAEQVVIQNGDFAGCTAQQLKLDAIDEWQALQEDFLFVGSKVSVDAFFNVELALVEAANSIKDGNYLFRTSQFCVENARNARDACVSNADSDEVTCLAGCVTELCEIVCMNDATAQRDNCETNFEGSVAGCTSATQSCTTALEAAKNAAIFAEGACLSGCVDIACEEQCELGGKVAVSGARVDFAECVSSNNPLKASEVFENQEDEALEGLQSILKSEISDSDSTKVFQIPGLKTEIVRIQDKIVVDSSFLVQVLIDLLDGETLSSSAAARFDECQSLFASAESKVAQAAAIETDPLDASKIDAAFSLKRAAVEDDKNAWEKCNKALELSGVSGAIASPTGSVVGDLGGENGPLWAAAVIIVIAWIVFRRKQ